MAGKYGCLLLLLLGFLIAQCDSSPPECQAGTQFDSNGNLIVDGNGNPILADNGPSPCDSTKVHCSNSGAVESGLINCTHVADTDSCGINAMQDFIDETGMQVYTPSDPFNGGTYADLFSTGGTCNTNGDYFAMDVTAI